MNITRRKLLQAIVVVAPAIQACGSDAAPPPPVPTPDGGPPEGGLPDAGPTIEDGQRYFPQSLASGDPRPGSVILWTRVFDETLPDADYKLTLQVASDSSFTNIVVTQADLPAAKAHDHALKVKLAGLMPKTTYYYRFLYQRDNKRLASKTGRTRTAPASTDDVPVRFAVTTCQDFIGRYYNTWQRLVQLDQDLDFIVFLGDYVYETTGDPSFMSTAGARNVKFTDPASAMTLGTPPVTYQAAQAVSNYRDLYKTVRSDAFLRAAHERYPFVFIWDDHEYSDDCSGAIATYTDGRMDEKNVDRRRNAEEAFFEYIPLDHPGVGDGAIDVDGLPRYPDTKIYRDLAFGKHLRLVVSDYRTYRPDHLIPEEAFPAKVIMDAAALMAANLTDVFKSDTFAYVDIDAPEYATQKTFLTIAYVQLAEAAGLDEATASARAVDNVKGLLSLVYVNAVLTSPQIGQAPIDPAGKPRGLGWIHMGKRDLFTSRGSRYIVLKDTFDAYTGYQYAATAGASENVWGNMQQMFVDMALAQPETWKVLVSSVSLTSLIFDLRDKMDIADATLRNRYYLNCDQWDGFPNRRHALLQKLAATGGGKVITVSGDIHASFASVEQGVACLTTPAISSNSVKAGAKGVALASGFDENSAIYRYVVTEIDQTFKAGNPGIAFADSDRHGFMIVELAADSAVATFHLTDSVNVATDYGTKPGDLPAAFQTKAFKVTAGTIVPA
jgi:alkaline phosphatase D